MYARGGAISVTATVTLGEQPASGSIAFEPLGGNGFDAPSAVYMGTATIAQDASGGTARVLVLRDPRYTCIGALLGHSNTNTTQDRISYDVNVAGHSFTFARLLSEMTTVNQGSLLLPCLYKTGQWNCRADNVDTFSLSFSFEIFCFDINVAQKVPLRVIQANFPPGIGFT